MSVRHVWEKFQTEEKTTIKEVEGQRWMYTGIQEPRGYVFKGKSLDESGQILDYTIYQLDEGNNVFISNEYVKFGSTRTYDRNSHVMYFKKRAFDVTLEADSFGGYRIIGVGVDSIEYIGIVAEKAMVKGNLIGRLSAAAPGVYPVNGIGGGGKSLSDSEFQLCVDCSGLVLAALLERGRRG